ncbi:MAG: hypothetical protein KDB93_11300, partial [Flavobacteriales bacterium]|nr:hypothetical protein [Flavobacteriales bacterium]
VGFNSNDQFQVPFNNQAGATVNQNGTGTFHTWYYSTYGAFTNAGTINLVNGNWRTDNTFTNTGTIDIPAGRLITFASTTHLNAGTTFTGSGAITSGGNTNQNFPWTNTTHSFTLSGGTWTNSAGNPTVFGVGGSFNWTGGILTGAGNYVTQLGSTATISGSDHYLGSILTNNGTINWNGGLLHSTGSGQLHNSNDAIFNINFTSANQLAVPFTNQAGGTVNQNGAGTFNTYPANVAGTFTNHGSINLVNGNWNFQQTNTHSATSALNIAASRTLTFTTATTLAGAVSNSGTVAGTINGFTGPTFTNNGSVTLANLPFTGSAAQTLDGTGSIAQLTLNNANGLALGGTQTVSNTLALTNGRITLGDNDLILTHATPANLSGANASRYIVTNGTGSLQRQVTGANVPFPIGTASSYMPATISLTSGPAEAFGARVQEGVNSDYGTPGTPTGSLVQNHQVERTWVLSEQTDGDNQATVQLQWNTADEGADFDRGNSGLYSYNGTDWVALDLAAAGGSNPYTRSAANVALFREFTVADGESTLPVVCDNGLVPGAPCDDGDPNTGDDAVDASCTCAGTPLEDCEGVPGGIALPGTACDDGNANTGNDAWDANCNCTGQLIDCLGVVGGTALPGTACNDGDPSTSDDAFSGECLCIGRPLNDDVCNAIAITMGMNGPFSNVGATLEPGESVPPTGDCWTWCGDADQTVWFTFVAPPSGRVSLNFGPNGPGEVGAWDSQIALWAAPDCAALTSGGATLLVANDKVASFLQDAQINPICLTPGQTYYVQVDAGYEPNAAFELHLVDEALDATIEASPTEVPFEGEAYVLIQGNYDATVLYTVNGGTPQSGTLPGGLLNIGTGPLTTDVTYELLSMELDGCTTSFTGRTATITVLSEPDCAGVPG